MQNYLTTEREVEGKVSIFAFPNPAFDPESEDSEPFRYELSEGETHWRSNAICVKTFDIKLKCPAGVNLVREAIATMRATIDKKRADLAEEVMKMEEQISKLQLLTYEPTTDRDYEVIPHESE